MTDGAPTVLVVDDNRVIADTYAQFLADDYEVRAVTSGSEALESLGPSTEVVVLDRRMPGVSGDDVLARIADRALDCRVVVVTAVEPDVDVVDLPFDGYLVKPVGRDELTAAVDEMHRRADYDDALRQFLALASKKATLEVRADEEELAESDAYARIEERLAAKRDALGVETETLERVVGGDAPDIADTDELPTN
ncbi:response regulator transcription factor [Halosimplex aquaticum]|uniref:Response regulator transcription factor n=1 Tax=Halosimplex aquaticum TaxID=3026162 RepID=A0ABD5Y6M2_9EURY|nr:response regulator [Halosimplex aquaticum]